jgi:hypothetical protein
MGLMLASKPPLLSKNENVQRRDDGGVLYFATRVGTRGSAQADFP